MKPTGAHLVLVERGELLSWLGLPGMSEDQAAPAVVRFTQDAGVTVELLDAPSGWPTELGVRGDLVIHGVTVDGGHPFTILGALVKTIATFDRARRLIATTLALGAHIDDTTTWSSAAFGTAHLHEWIGDTGLRLSARRLKSGRLKRLAYEWTPPATYVVERPDARLSFMPDMETAGNYGPDRQISTNSLLNVRPAQPTTLDQLHRAYGRPLLAFCTFAADRPDALLYETVSDKKRRKRAVILRSGRSVQSREWRPDSRFLFRAEQINDIAEIYGRWMDLWERSSAEIATFVDAISEGNTFSRARLLAAVAALEAYWRTRLKVNAEGTKTKGRSLLDKLKDLRTHAGIEPQLIGVTNANLKLIAAARNLYAHLDQTIITLSDEEIDDHLVANCRRSAALLQACLLRDLGIEPEKAQSMFEEHLSSWPLS